MRETLFRGKRVDNGEYVEGGSIINAQDGIWIIPTNGIIQYTADSRKLVYVEAIPVVPETVCEFTGLTDKNGTKIFEGDIVSSNKRKTWIGRGKVWFGNGTFWCGERDWAKLLRMVCLEDEQAVVIGNVHDNPELLKEGE